MRNTTLKYILLFLAQAVLWNFFPFSQHLTLVFLPAMLLCLPQERGTIWMMLVAFVTGVALDFIVTGQLGLTSFALVPVALLRRPVVSLIFGPELFARGEELSFERQGWQKFVPAILLLTAVFLIPFIWVDNAGTRPFWFCTLKFVLSLVASSALSVVVALVMLKESGERWR